MSSRLEDLLARLEGRVAPERLDAVRDGLARGRSAGPVVVAVLGPTGSGRSAVVNALAGRAVSAESVRRPATTRPLAVTWQVREDEAGSLAELGVDEWVAVSGRPGLAGAVLVDLPDLDSTAGEHRAAAARVAAAADLQLWILDPQKYADALVHHEHLAARSGQGETTLVALNQIDRVAAEDRPEVLADLGRILAAEGLGDAVILPVSARSGAGIEDLAASLAEAVRRARGAGLRQAVAELAETVGPPSREPVPIADLRRVAEAAAAGGDAAREARELVTRATSHLPGPWQAEIAGRTGRRLAAIRAALAGREEPKRRWWGRQRRAEERLRAIETTVRAELAEPLHQDLAEHTDIARALQDAREGRGSPR